jgi:osmotically-inducible protein OsmY
MMNIGAEVANALYWDFAVPRYSVTAEVHDGLVTLRGVVRRAYEKSSAEASVRRVSGVVGVRNEINVRSVEGLRQPTAHV